MTVRPLLPTVADKEGNVHSAPPLLLVPIMCVTHHQTPRHTPAFCCWPFLAQPWMSPPPRPSRARGLHNRQMGGRRGSLAGPLRSGRRLVPDYRLLSQHSQHTWERVLCPPQRRPRSQLGTAPLQKRSLLTGPQGILEEITQPTRREGEGLVSIAVPPTPWVDFAA